MRNLLLFLLLTLSLTGRVQAQTRTIQARNLPADSLTRRIRFAGVVAVPGVSAAELQARAREWVALTFEDAHQATQLDDAARGVLIGRGYTIMWRDVTDVGTGGTAQPLSFTLRLDFRDGRYRYEVRDLGLALFPHGPSNPSLYGAPGAASQQAYETAAWQIGATATLAASPRHALLQPDYSPDPDDYDVAARYGRRWPSISKTLSSTILQLLTSLRQHETAPAAKW